MPDVSYTILIKDERSEGGASARKKKSASVPNAATKEKGSFNLPPQLKRMATVGFALHAIDTAVSFATDTVELRTGNSTYHQRVNAVKSSIVRTVGTAATAIGAGMAFGPVGAAVAVAGVAANAILNVSKQNYSLSIRRAVNEYEVQQANIRAGSLGNRGGALK